MAQERAKGAIRQVVGKMREAAGKVLGGSRTKAAAKPAAAAKTERGAVSTTPTAKQTPKPTPTPTRNPAAKEQKSKPTGKKR